MTSRIVQLTLLAGILAACGDVSARSGPPVAGTTPSTINYERQEAARMTQGSTGLAVGAPR